MLKSLNDQINVVVDCISEIKAQLNTDQFSGAIEQDLQAQLVKKEKELKVITSRLYTEAFKEDSVYNIACKFLKTNIHMSLEELVLSLKEQDVEYICPFQIALSLDWVSQFHTDIQEHLVGEITLENQEATNLVASYVKTDGDKLLLIDINPSSPVFNDIVYNKYSTIEKLEKTITSILKYSI